MTWRNTRMRSRVIAGVVVGAFVAAAVFGAGLTRGWWRMNHPSPARFPVWGVDVSRHQGDIDWTAVERAPQIGFAYLKATEGGDWVDPRFAANWQAARRAGLRVGDAEVQAALVLWLEAVTSATGREPIVYATREAYDRFLRAPQLRRRLWIRDVWKEPRLPQTDPWALWQFDARARVAGIPAFVDLDVFRGSRAELERL